MKKAINLLVLCGLIVLNSPPTSYSANTDALIPTTLLLLSSDSDIKTVTSLTGRIWMDRNLGAARIATSVSDIEAYGDLYQWGRLSDGHEKRNSGMVSTLSDDDVPGHDDFITVNGSPNDWRNPQNDNLWQNTINVINNTCPQGFRLPTQAEFQEEIDSWTTQDAEGAFTSPLKLVMAGFRGSDGTVNSGGGMGLYWASTIDGSSAYKLEFYEFAGGAAFSDGSFYRACGLSIRCIKK